MWRSVVSRFRSMVMPARWARIDIYFKNALPLFFAAMVIGISVSDLSAQELSGPFSGRWDITLKGTAKDLPSWIEVSEDHGQLKVVLVGPTDHATLLKQAEIKNGELAFVSPKGEEGFDADTTYKARLVGGRLRGDGFESGSHLAIAGQAGPSSDPGREPPMGKACQFIQWQRFCWMEVQRSQQEGQLGGRKRNSSQQRPRLGDHQCSYVL